jgi:hypothetical protein
MDFNWMGHISFCNRKNTEAVLNASEKVGLEVNAEKAKYLFLSRHLSSLCRLSALNT